MIELLRRQTGDLDGFFVVVEEDEEVISAGFTERAMLNTDEVITTTAPVIVRMLGFDPCLARFNLYGASPGRGDIE